MLSLAAVVIAAPVAEAVPATIPLTITNNSGRSEPVYVYNLGTNLATGQQGWADASGTFHAWPAGGEPPVPAPDASIAGPSSGQSTTIQVPKLSGRIYFSYGQKLVFRLAPGGLVQPAVQNPSDPNRNILFNWSEYTLNDDGLWINSTQVDMFAAPYAVGVRRGDGSSAVTGHLRPGGYAAVYAGLRAQGWGALIQTRSDGTELRALAPGYGIEVGALPTNVLADFIERVWAKYRSEPLTVAPFADRPDVRYTGRVEGESFVFRNTAGGVATTFVKPDSDSVLRCFKHLDAPNDQVRGPISRTLCAGFNRSTLLVNPSQPDPSPGAFYADPVTNHYSRIIHAQMVDGKAYGFPFDDVGHHESLVHDGNPQAASLILDPFS